MVLHPLTEVVVRMLMPVCVGSRQLVVHVLRDGKGGDRQEKQDQADGQTDPEHEGERLSNQTLVH
jgi:hypothetical protein